MLLPPIRWALLTILLTAASCIGGNEEVPSGTTIKVTVDTIQKVCATVYADQESALAKYHKGYNTGFSCFGRKCGGVDYSKTVILHVCQDTNTYQQLNMNPGDDLSSLDTEDKKVSGNVSPLLSELQAVIHNIESILRRSNETGGDTAIYQYHLDSMIKNLSKSLGGLNLIDPRQFQQSILHLIEGTKKDKLNVNEPGYHSNKVISNVLSSLQSLNNTIRGISGSQQSKQRAPAVPGEEEILQMNKYPISIQRVPLAPGNRLELGPGPDEIIEIKEIKQFGTVPLAPRDQVKSYSKTYDVPKKENTPSIKTAPGTPTNKINLALEADELHQIKNFPEEIQTVPGEPGNQVNLGLEPDESHQNKNYPIEIKKVPGAPSDQVNLGLEADDLHQIKNIPEEFLRVPGAPIDQVNIGLDSVELHQTKNIPEEFQTVPGAPSDQVNLGSDADELLQIKNIPEEFQTVPGAPSDQVNLGLDADELYQIKNIPEEFLRVPGAPSDQVNLGLDDDEFHQIKNIPEEFQTVPGTPNDQVDLGLEPDESYQMNNFPEEIGKGTPSYQVDNFGLDADGLHQTNNFPEEIGKVPGTPSDQVDLGSDADESYHIENPEEIQTVPGIHSDQVDNFGLDADGWHQKNNFPEEIRKVPGALSDQVNLGSDGNESYQIKNPEEIQTVPGIHSDQVDNFGLDADELHQMNNFPEEIRKVPGAPSDQVNLGSDADESYQIKHPEEIQTVPESPSDQVNLGLEPDELHQIKKNPEEFQTVPDGLSNEVILGSKTDEVSQTEKVQNDIQNVPGVPSNEVILGPDTEEVSQTEKVQNDIQKVPGEPSNEVILGPDTDEVSQTEKIQNDIQKDLSFPRSLSDEDRFFSVQKEPYDQDDLSSKTDEELTRKKKKEQKEIETGSVSELHEESPKMVEGIWNGSVCVIPEINQISNQVVPSMEISEDNQSEADISQQEDNLYRNIKEALAQLDEFEIIAVTPEELEQKVVNLFQSNLIKVTEITKNITKILSLERKVPPYSGIGQHPMKEETKSTTESDNVLHQKSHTISATQSSHKTLYYLHEMMSELSKLQEIYTLDGGDTKECDCTVDSLVSNIKHFSHHLSEFITYELLDTEIIMDTADDITSEEVRYDVLHRVLQSSIERLEKFIRLFEQSGAIQRGSIKSETEKNRMVSSESNTADGQRLTREDVIKRVILKFEKLNKNIQDLSVVVMYNGTGSVESTFGEHNFNMTDSEFESKIDILMQNLQSATSEMGIANGVNVKEFTKIMHQIWDTLVLIADDLKIIFMEKDLDSPHSGNEDDQQAEKLHANLRDIIQEYTQLLSSIITIGHEVVPVKDTRRSSTPPIDLYHEVTNLSKEESLKNIELISVFQMEAGIDETYVPLNESFYNHTTEFLEEKEHIPELIQLLKFQGVEDSFWISEFGDTVRREETIDTLDQLLVQWNLLAHTSMGYHKIAKLICVLLRLLEKGFVTGIDLIKYIKYFYWILDTQREGAMKSGSPELLERKPKVLPEGDKPIDTLIKTITGPVFRDGYWIPEHGGTEKMASTIATLAEIFLHGERAAKSLSDVSKIMCILITLQDTGLINLKQVELDAMIKYLFPILENFSIRGKDHVSDHSLQKVDGSYQGPYSDYFVKRLYGKNNITTVTRGMDTADVPEPPPEDYIDIR